ncbi:MULTISPECIES: PEP-CTERM sorting domain-containing protein [unclassified Janthinobacterium]|uniref:PEP-CTERM sorting domain-containing protein n=1 Tax=unclassified Janthinobacterium TaxID=2610881 RepID=UPI00034514D4|nr:MULTISPECIES: PEP-CTERM sorting domain-containing protein [unclassified Janthinobacterium]MEC5162391.1 hypothetical protein [Janthinobacterium sp. CG_S6]
MLAKKKNTTTNLLALALAVTSFSAQADNLLSATVSIGNVSYQLIDMNPTDGIAPSLTFYGQGFNADSSTSRGSVNRDSYYDYSRTHGATGVDSIGGSAATLATPTTFSASSSVASNAYSSHFTSNARGGRDFALSADTQVIFFATTSLSASNSGTTDSAWARSGFSASLYTSGLPTHNSSFLVEVTARDAQDIHTQMVGVLQSARRVQYGTLTMTVETESEWRVAVPVSLAPSISAVPEPGTYAMLLAGLGLVGFAARRKRANAR